MNADVEGDYGIAGVERVHGWRDERICQCR